MSGRWIKNRKHGGPDIWYYVNKVPGNYPAIAILKNNNKIIAEFFGPINYKNNNIIEHIKSEYQTEGELKLFRLGTSHKIFTI